MNLPTTINVDGIEYPIVTDFKAVFEYYRISKHAMIDDNSESAMLMLRIFCVDIPTNFMEAIRQIGNFLACGEKIEDSNIESTDNIPVIDFEQDYWNIWAGFIKEYRIDIEKEDLHWWKFRYLLQELSDKSSIKQIIQIRDYEPDSKDPNLSKILAAKERYKIT